MTTAAPSTVGELRGILRHTGSPVTVEAMNAAVDRLIALEWRQHLPSLHRNFGSDTYEERQRSSSAPPQK